jgi:hypothetical protein
MFFSLVLGVQFLALPVHFTAHKSADFHVQSEMGRLEKDCNVCGVIRSNPALGPITVDLLPASPVSVVQLFFISGEGLAFAVLARARGPPADLA